MTWGEIDGTPFRLDGGGTPLINRTPGPVFKMPAIPRRDEIAMQLAEKASKAHRAKKEAALKRGVVKIIIVSYVDGYIVKMNLNKCQNIHFQLDKYPIDEFRC